MNPRPGIIRRVNRSVIATAILSALLFSKAAAGRPPAAIEAAAAPVDAPGAQAAQHPTPPAPASQSEPQFDSAAAKPDWAQPVTLQVEDLPLRVILKNLSKTTGAPLEAEKPLQECKAMVIVHGRSLAEVMKGLAAVFGGQWVTLKRNGKDVYQLRYLKVVADYLAFRDQARQKAREDARQRQYRSIMNQINYVFAHLDDPKDPGVSHVIGADGLPLITSVQDMSLARLLKALPTDDVQRFAHALADAIPVEDVIDGDSHSAVLHAPPVILPQGGLTPAESSLARQFLANQSQDAALSGIAANPAGVSLGLTSDSSSDLGIAWVIPGQAHAPFSKAFSFFHSPSSVLAAEVTEAMNAALAKRPFPLQALLDAAIDKDGNPQPAVNLQPDLAGKMVDLEGNPPLRWQLLAFLGEHAALNVISDYATLAERMTLPRGPQTLQRDLDLASKSYGAVFREDSGILLARYVDWPDLDEEEAPWPLPEGWIQEKTKGQGLRFDDYIALAGLDTAQLNALARYQDRNVSFAKNRIVAEVPARIPAAACFLCEPVGAGPGENRRRRPSVHRSPDQSAAANRTIAPCFAHRRQPGPARSTTAEI